MIPPSPPITVLLVEDEPQICRFIKATLEAEGLTVFVATTGQQGLVEAASRQPELLIIDLGLPDLEGVQLIRELRGFSDAPLLVLSARTQEGEKVSALDAGADDYLTKPFGVPELLARIRAHLRRRQSRGNSSELRFGDNVLDFARRQLTRRGQIVHLTPLEYRLLVALARDAGKVLTHRQLLREVWGPNFSEHPHYLRVYMAHLRQKLEDSPAQPHHLLTETGVGYRLLIDNEP